MRLIYVQTGKEVEIGDVVWTVKGMKGRVTGWSKPKKPSSTGRVYIKEMPEEVITQLLGEFNANHEFFPSVIKAAWVDREDQKDFSGEFMKNVQWGYE